MPNKTFTQFRVDNVVTTLPTTLAYGEEAYYKDANGNLTLWVGHEDGSAWPAVGYKEFAMTVVTGGTQTMTFRIKKNDMGASVAQGGISEEANIEFTNLGNDTPPNNTVYASALYAVDGGDVPFSVGISFGVPTQIIFTDSNGNTYVPNYSATNGGFPVIIRIYP